MYFKHVSKRVFLGAGCLMLVTLALGCDSSQDQQQDTYITVPAQPAQPIMAGTCVNAQQQVVDDQWCNESYIQQQRALAIRQHNNDLLASLLIYHMLYTSQPYYVGQVIPRTAIVYRTRPANTIIQTRSTYVTNVTTHKIIVNNGRATTIATPTTRTVVRTTSNSPSYTSSKPKPSSTTSGGLGSSYKPSTSSSYRSFSTPSGMRSSSSSFSRRR